MLKHRKDHFSAAAMHCLVCVQSRKTEAQSPLGHSPTVEGAASTWSCKHHPCQYRWNPKALHSQVPLLKCRLRTSCEAAGQCPPDGSPAIRGRSACTACTPCRGGERRSRVRMHGRSGSARSASLSEKSSVKTVFTPGGRGARGAPRPPRASRSAASDSPARRRPRRGRGAPAPRRPSQCPTRPAPRTLSRPRTHTP